MKAVYIRVALLGIMTAFLAVVIEQIIATWSQAYFNQEIVLDYYKNFTWFLFIAVLAEEGLKFLAIRYVILERFAVRGKNFIISSFILGLFFGAVEIGFILLSNLQAASLLSALDREIIISLSSIALIQTSTALLMSALLLAKERITSFSFFSVLILPVILHFLYNFLVIQKSNYTDFLIFLIITISFLMSFLILTVNRSKLSQ